MNMICLLLTIVSIPTIPEIQANKLHTVHWYHHSFTVSSLNLWNSLSRNIQESTSLSSFKSALFTFIGAKPQW